MASCVKRGLQFLAVLLGLIVILGIFFYAWDRGVGPFQPRYLGRPIGTWFPRWYDPQNPPAAAMGFRGPENLGVEAVPFLVRELGRGEPYEHRAHRWLSQRLPRSLAVHLPTPYPAIANVSTLTIWLTRIRDQPGGPAALASQIDTAAPFARRRLLILLGSSRTDLPTVVPTLQRALQHPDAETRRAAGRALLRLDPAVTQPIVPEILAVLVSDTTLEGRRTWVEDLPRLLRFPQHTLAIRQALAGWDQAGVPEARPVLEALASTNPPPARR